MMKSKMKGDKKSGNKNPSMDMDAHMNSEDHKKMDEAHRKACRPDMMNKKAK